MKEGLDKSPQELKEQFYRLQSRDDLASLLGVTVEQLNYYLYVQPSGTKYKEFYIAKKSGAPRRISAPASPIKVIQRNLKQVLEAVYIPKSSTHGFIRGRKIVSNARMHVKRKYVLNLDLEDFFPTIHFGRVRGMFLAKPYGLNTELATILAQICCHQRVLPQGAPTSPIVSNMICARLDDKLKQLAQRHQCTYSRYADDITFSTNRSIFPPALAYHSEIGAIQIGEELFSVIDENGFNINLGKVRLQPKQQRQEVTGLTVNKYPNIQRKYIKQLRAILYSWENHNLEATANKYFEKYSHGKYSDPKVYRPPFQRIILGKIQYVGMIKGRNNPVYLGLLRRFCKLAPEYYDVNRLIGFSSTKPYIYTEGKTDRRHIEAALRGLKAKGLFSNLFLEFSENDLTEGADRLLSKLNNHREHLEKHTRPHIFLFDRDRLDIFRKIRGSEDFYSWGNNVYSFAIPIPKHRDGLERLCIEFCYMDKDLLRFDKNGRRIFLSTEFNPETQEHYSIKGLRCKNPDILQGEPKIVDNGIEDNLGEKIALSKSGFADNVYEQREGFEDIDFSGFKALFEKIQLVINDFDSGSI